MRSQRLFGNRRVEHEPDHPARLGRSGRVMRRLGDLSIRTRFFLGLGFLTLVAIAVGLVGFQGLASMNRLLVRMNDDDRAMIGRLAETRSRLSAAISGLSRERTGGDGKIPAGLLSDAEQAARRLDELIVEGREREQRLTDEGQRRYGVAVTWLIGLSSLAVVLSLTLAYLYSRVVARPLVSLVGAMERVAAGDLTVSIKPESQDEVGQVAVAMGQMVQRQRMDAAQLVQNERLRTLGEVSSSVAHKFNNLLAVTLGQAELLQLDASSPREGLEAIRDAALEGRETVRRLQHFTRSGAFREEPAWVLPRQAVEEVIASGMPAWEARGHDRGVSYEVVADYDPVPEIRVPPSALTEVLQNLILNAFEAMPAGGQVRIRVRADLRHVLFSVSDDGEGIPPAVRPRIFDPFFTTKPAPSSGLGLSICLRIMLTLGGTVTVDSGPVRGSTFTVRLPLLREAQPAPARPAPPRRMPKPARILVIDDEPLVVETLAGLLQQAGHSVETALTGSAGIERYRQRRFDCVVTDLLMPGLNGLTVGRAIKDQDPGAYVVLLTAQAEQLDAKQTEAAGVDRVFTKPVGREQLLSIFEIEERMVHEPVMETSCPRL
jgi:signal transduction histidine kinase/ActR/RegA family two-component response regulator